MEPERIVRAAIRYKDEIFHVISPKRHHHVIGIMHARGFGPECMHDQGFLTNKNRFVDRKEGLAIATAAGQIKEKVGKQDLLWSEDMW